MRAALFLVVTSAVVGNLLAQYPGSLGCTRHVTLPSSAYTVPTYQPQCQCQCYQPQQCPRVNIVPYNYCQCQPPILQQNIVPPPCPVYCPQSPIIVPIPAPPKDCESAQTTVTTAHQPSNVTHPISNHPPICVQTVYVAKDDEEDKKEEKKCECKKKKKNYESEPEDCEREERALYEARRRAAYLKRQALLRDIKYKTVIRRLLGLTPLPSLLGGSSSSLLDPGFADFDPSDPSERYSDRRFSDPLDRCFRCRQLGLVPNRRNERPFIMMMNP